MATELVTQTNSLNIAIIGCGKLGTSLLIGICKARLQDEEYRRMSLNLVLTVRSASSKARLENLLRQFDFESASQISAVKVSVQLHDANPMVASQANIIILACKPTVYLTICQDKAFQDATALSSGKVLVSLVGGTCCSKIRAALCDGSYAVETMPLTFVRAIPNIAAQLRQSITSLSILDNESHGHEETKGAISVVTTIFEMVGRIIWAPGPAMDLASTIGASGVALFAAIIEQFHRSACLSNESISSEAILQATAQAAYGAAGMILAGFTPQHVIHQVATKGGSTQIGLDALAGSGMSTAIHGSVMATVTATHQLSSGPSKALRKTAIG